MVTDETRQALLNMKAALVEEKREAARRTLQARAAASRMAGRLNLTCPACGTTDCKHLSQR